MKNRRKEADNSWIALVALAVVAAAVGNGMGRVTKAATYAVSHETETGTTSGNAEILTAQAGASASSTVIFNEPVSGGS